MDHGWHGKFHPSDIFSFPILVPHEHLFLLDCFSSPVNTWRRKPEKEISSCQESLVQFGGWLCQLNSIRWIINALQAAAFKWLRRGSLGGACATSALSSKNRLQASEGWEAQQTIFVSTVLVLLCVILSEWMGWIVILDVVGALTEKPLLFPLYMSQAAPS